jgi:hypothetical protein
VLEVMGFGIRLAMLRSESGMGSTFARYPTPTSRRASRYPSETPVSALASNARVRPHSAFWDLVVGSWTESVRDPSFKIAPVEADGG